MLGYRHYADDVLEYFVQKSVANGIDIIRIFDALNDIRNLETAVKAAKKEGAHAQIAISYTLGEVFTEQYYIDYAKRIEEAGADSICIKDMAALLTPYETERLVQQLGKYGINVNSIVINQVVVFEKSSSRLCSLIKSVLVVNVLLVVRCRINILIKFSIYSKISTFFLFLN